MLLALAGCRPDPDAPRGRPEVRVTSAPAPGPDPDAPMVAVLSAETDRPATVTVEVQGPDEGWTTAPSTVPGREHRLEVFGLLPEVPYTLVVHATDARGRVGDSEPVGYTPPPVEWKSLRTRVVRDDPDADPGLWLVVTWHGHPESALQLFDDQGRLRWIYQTHAAWVNDDHLAPDGTVWYEDEGEIVQIALDGRVLRRYVPARTREPGPGEVGVDTAGFHHSISLLDDGVVALTKDPRSVPDYPTDVLHPSETAPAVVAGDRIVEFGLDGATRAEWATHDLLDVHRVRWDSLDPVDGYGEESGLDWTHTNGTAVDPADGSIVFSCRHQDAVFDVGLDGELKWILGTPNGWGAPWSDLLLRPVGPVEWPRHQHAPQVVAHDGDTVDLVLFDNGNYRPAPGTPDDRDLVDLGDEYSRVVEYRIDTRARTVEQVWTYDRDDEDWFSDCCSNAFVSPSGHVFVGDVNGRVFEVTRTEPPQKVLEIAWRPAAGEASFSRYMERAYRVPDLRALPAEVEP